MPAKPDPYGPTMTIAEVRDALGIRPSDLERLFADRGQPILENAMGEPAVASEHAAALIRDIRTETHRTRAARRAYMAYIEAQARTARLERLAQAREAFEKARQKSKKMDDAWRAEQTRRREQKAAEIEAKRRAEWEAAGRPKPWSEFLKDFKWRLPAE